MFWACDLYFLRKKAFFTENVAWPNGYGCRHLNATEWLSALHILYDQL